VHLGAALMDQQSWGGRAGEVDLGTDLPCYFRTILMYVGPSIDLVERLHGLRMPADGLREERER